MLTGTAVDPFEAEIDGNLTVRHLNSELSRLEGSRRDISAELAEARLVAFGPSSIRKSRPGVTTAEVERLEHRLSEIDAQIANDRQLLARRRTSVRAELRRVKVREAAGRARSIADEMRPLLARLIALNRQLMAARNVTGPAPL